MSEGKKGETADGETSLDKHTKNVLNRYLGQKDGRVRALQKTLLKEQEQVLAKWRSPIELLELEWLISNELGQKFHAKWAASATEEQKKLCMAQSLIVNRACQTALASITLLRAGLPGGAQSHTRTLHEIAVVSTLLRNGGPSLAERYLDYAQIDKLKAMRELNGQGVKAASGELLVKQETTVAALKAKYDNRFDVNNGWASEIIGGNGNISFKQLEVKAHESEQFRPFYRFASFSVHAGSTGDIVRVGGRTTGPCMEGLESPGVATAHYLYAIVVSALTSIEVPDLIVHISALGDLSEMVRIAFLEAGGMNPQELEQQLAMGQ